MRHSLWGEIVLISIDEKIRLDEDLIIRTVNVVICMMMADEKRDTADVLPSRMIQCNDKSTGLKPLGIRALGRWLPFGSLLFCPEVGGGGTAVVHTLLTMNTLLTIA